MLMFGERERRSGAAGRTARTARARSAADRAIRRCMSGVRCTAISARSLATHDSVMDEFLTSFPATVELAVSAMLLAVLIGMPAGIVAALRRGSTTDYSVMGARADRLFDADILVGDPADPAVLGDAGITPVSGPDRHRL